MEPEKYTDDRVGLAAVGYGVPEIPVPSLAELRDLIDPANGLDLREFAGRLEYPEFDVSLHFDRGFLSASNILCVDDYKSGAGWHIRPRLSLQMHCYLVFFFQAVGKRLGYDRITGRIIEPDKTSAPLVDTFDEADIEVMSKGIHRVGLAALEERPAFSPGEHCKWCDAMDRCPVRQEEVSAIGDIGTDPSVSWSSLTPDQKGYLYQRAISLSAVCDKIQRLAKSDLLEGNAIPISGNKHLEIRTQRPRKIDMEKGYAVIRSYLGTEAAPILKISFGEALKIARRRYKNEAEARGHSLPKGWQSDFEDRFQRALADQGALSHGERHLIVTKETEHE